MGEKGRCHGAVLLERMRAAELCIQYALVRWSILGYLDNSKLDRKTENGVWDSACILITCHARFLVTVAVLCD